ncbi:hypothetical protein TSOC_014745 [Tetrabaena socialis]|uniref:C3H1-type domain-containing protein n=1 Tax=Tetrabaena socialis TaxID=47790 RepID=A0A2J7ZGS1_9CHLO|nr:hypothetical protein TSOC_014745 [Tetrabaena socialis]|eukprot:PNG99475.1 hypothetical protein TSOC_014745 [Tetrabaena socialis]
MRASSAHDGIDELGVAYHQQAALMSTLAGAGHVPDIGPNEYHLGQAQQSPQAGTSGLDFVGLGGVHSSFAAAGPEKGERQPPSPCVYFMRTGTCAYGSIAEV